MSNQLNRIITEAGITYNSLHWWLRRTLGSAIKCENIQCERKSNHFVWALKKGKRYDKKVENFFQLCRKCHIAYDMTLEWSKSLKEGRLKAQKARIGMKHTVESKRKIKEALKKRFPEGRKVWNKGKAWSEETRLKMSLARKEYYARIKK